jgi:hypothetical protein
LQVQHFYNVPSNSFSLIFSLNALGRQIFIKTLSGKRLP